LARFGKMGFACLGLSSDVDWELLMWGFEALTKDKILIGS
jgi:hypothetical protein